MRKDQAISTRMDYLDVVKFVLGSLLTLVNVMVIGFVQKFGIKKKATKTFLVQMCVAAAITGMVLILQGIFSVIGSINMTVCRGLQSALLSSSGLYLSHMLFMFLDVVLSIKKLMITSALSTKLTFLMSTFCSAVWIAVFITGMVVLTPDITNLRECVTTFYTKVFGICIACVNIVQTLCISMVIGYGFNVASKGLRSVHPSDNMNIPTDTKLQRLKRHLVTLRTLFIALVVFATCMSTTIALRVIMSVCRHHCNEDLTHAFLMVFASLPCLINAVVFLVRNKRFQYACTNQMKNVMCLKDDQSVAPINNK